MHNQYSIQDFKPKHGFFIGLDSDGCVINSMDIKHKKSFGPLFIEHFNLTREALFVQQTWEFVNLYSRMRGSNRFKALSLTMDLLNKRKEIQDSGMALMPLQGLKNWFERESKLGNPALEKAIAETGDEDLKRALGWSLAVNQSVAEIMPEIKPFDHVEQALQQLQGRADLVAVSQMPTETLVHEWQAHGLDRYIDLICGQEAGTKAELLAFPASSGHYEDDHILMVGDAPGDLAAAQSNHVLYYPIIPGNENMAWKRFCDEAIDKFFTGTYAGEYEASLIEEFHASLPENPPWK